MIQCRTPAVESVLSATTPSHYHSATVKDMMDAAHGGRRCSARRQATHAAKPHARVVLDCKQGWRSCSIRAGNPFTVEQPPHSKTLDKCCFLCSISPRIAHANTASARPCKLSSSCCRMYGGTQPLGCTKDSPNNALHQLAVTTRKATLWTAKARAQSMCFFVSVGVQVCTDIEDLPVAP
jgi:hypothetical protein